MKKRGSLKKVLLTHIIAYVTVIIVDITDGIEKINDYASENAAATQEQASSINEAKYEL